MAGEQETMKGTVMKICVTMLMALFALTSTAFSAESLVTVRLGEQESARSRG